VERTNDGEGVISKRDGECVVTPTHGESVISKSDSVCNQYKGWR
jgi:hypothetical protein